MSYDFYTTDLFTNNATVGQLTMPNTFTQAGDLPIVDASGVLSLTTPLYTTGPNSSAVSQVPVFSDTTGKLLTASTATISNTGLLTVDNLKVGVINYPSVDGTAGSFLTTNGSGTLVFAPSVMPSLIYASMSVDQNTNLTAGDHLKIDTQSFINGNTITLDTTTAYTNAPNVASVGRFTLSPGSTFLLECIIPRLTLNKHNSTFTIQWFNSDTDTAIDNPLVYTGIGTNVIYYGHVTLRSVITTTVSSKVECRIVSNSGLTAVNTCYVYIKNLNQ